MKFKIILEKCIEHFEADNISYTSDYIVGYKGQKVSTVVVKENVIAVIEE